MLGIDIGASVRHRGAGSGTIAPVTSTASASNIGLSGIRVTLPDSLSWDAAILAVGVACRVATNTLSKILTVRATAAQTLIIARAFLAIGQTKLTLIGVITEP